MKVDLMMTEATPALFIAKMAGAFAGSLISLAYILPKGRREALLRLLVGVVTGLAFGTTAGVKIADKLGVLDKLDAVEVTLMGATLASLCAWWAMGVLHRFSDLAPTLAVSKLRPNSEKVKSGDR